MDTPLLDTYDTRTPDSEGWRGIPFRHPALNVPADTTYTAPTTQPPHATAAADGGKHDGGPMPPEAPRDPAPGGGDDD
ncbi:hypothetical protein ACMA1D_08010 [Streptomyces sp. 796.1]|uniref:hypothetical protein n=1 Tax=Streptomyces sp. 796.1 TaxID=3163029 RepID=UPI0039C921F4